MRFFVNTAREWLCRLTLPDTLKIVNQTIFCTVEFTIVRLPFSSKKISKSELQVHFIFVNKKVKVKQKHGIKIINRKII